MFFTLKKRKLLAAVFFALKSPSNTIDQLKTLVDPSLAREFLKKKISEH